MSEFVYYTVKQIDGDYAVLMSDTGLENRVARALLPYEIDEGTKLRRENFVYEIVE